MNAIDVRIGRRVRAQREEVGTSVEDLAKGLSTTAERIEVIERGEERMSASELQQAAELLGVPVGSFFRSDYPLAGNELKVGDLAREGMALNRAFAAITDPKLRADVVEHVEAVARYDARQRTDASKS